MSGLILSVSELIELTTYKLPSKQVECMKQFGYTRARVIRGRAIVERPHFEAINQARTLDEQSGTEPNVAMFKDLLSKKNATPKNH